MASFVKVVMFSILYFIKIFQLKKLFSTYGINIIQISISNKTILNLMFLEVIIFTKRQIFL